MVGSRAILLLLVAASCDPYSTPTKSERAAPEPTAPAEQTILAPVPDPRFSAAVDLSRPGPAAAQIFGHTQTEVEAVLGPAEIARAEISRHLIPNGPGEGDDVDVTVHYKRGKATRIEISMTDAADRVAAIQAWLQLPAATSSGKYRFKTSADGPLTVVIVRYTRERAEDRVDYNYGGDPDRFSMPLNGAAQEALRGR
jgi:hypothetical protein